MGFNYDVTEKLSFSPRFYYCMSFTGGVATLNGKGERLSRELGKEIDVIVDYKISKNTLFNITAGAFLPGRYYKAERDDPDGSLFSPNLRADNKKPNSAYQIEISLEFIF
jgi:hypothetical protein